ncbi:type I methionyl aminopeptidase [Candidatus Tremblaya phenacola]|uniref:type I methionyl aminopeptidase n=1 Tax=Candidatus Tremblayella phenacoccinincola TaxID=1010676 RepID=UPI00132F7B0D|nr:type I methionyl aminopeptidase [Candidatus Tremblaya phenacola]KAH0998170.1 Methionine aminopeptidase [Candidatus Tremblaya phenacola]
MLTYTKKDVTKIRLASMLASEVLEMIEPYIKPTIATGEIDALCFKYITNILKATPACLGYYGFPKSICVSINEVVCHGIPKYNHIVKEGDIVNIDVAVLKEGFYGDTSKMFYAGEAAANSKELCIVVQESLYLAIRSIKPGIRLRTIGKDIQAYVEDKNYSVVKEYCGHGIGSKFHEEPQIPHYNTYDNGVLLKEDMAFTIEPMINAGESYTYVEKDGWSVKTKDHSLSAQYEHTILVTKDGCEIMSLRAEEPLSKHIHNL